VLFPRLLKWSGKIYFNECRISQHLLNVLNIYSELFITLMSRFATHANSYLM
jgi:hypothetical protein